MDQQNGNSKAYHISISKALPGMILAKDIYSKNDQLILNKGTEIDANTIAKLMLYSIDSIIVYENENDLRAAVNYDSFAAQLRETMEFREFAKQYDKTLDILRDALKRINEGDFRAEEERLSTAINDMVKNGNSKARLFDMLHCIRDYDEPTYMHSVNVSIICNVFGEWLNMNEEDKRVLTIAGLMHDIGKTAIPKEILDKPSSLTDEEYKLMKNHPKLGYDMVKDQDIDERIKLAILQHHERYEGSGYPGGLTGEGIDSFATLVSIADVYDAMTSDRVYRPRICPFDVINNFEYDQKLKFNPKYLIPILEQIAETYIHHTVKLSDDNKGEIILVNKTELSKPIIKVDNNFIDLSKRRNIKILEVL